MLRSNVEQAENERILISSVFGDSDSDSEADAHPGVNTLSPIEHAVQNWVRIDRVRGLWLCKGFLNFFKQQQVVAAINAEGWFDNAFNNQAMRFGELPWWALELSNLIYSTTCSYILENEDLFLDSSIKDVADNLPLSLQVLWRVPLFDQMIANCYQPGEGICPHVDLLKFEDGIAVVSLESTCVMHFTHTGPSCHKTLSSNESKHLYVDQAEHTFGRPEDDDSREESLARKIPILLEPGDLVLMSGEARYNWTHEINRSENFQTWNGEKITQQRRTSVTLRKLLLSH